MSDDSRILYTINDALTALNTHFGGHADDGVLDDLTHHLAEALGAVVPAPDPPRLIAILNDDGELACPECGNTMFGYEENVVEYRYPGDQDPVAHTVSVIWAPGATGDSGDSDPGLICDNNRHQGCGKPIDLPPGWEISYG